jgi:hypothetical protein
LIPQSPAPPVIPHDNQTKETRSPQFDRGD